MPRPDSPFSPLQRLAERLDQAISLASKDEWDHLDENKEALLACLDEIRHTDYVALANSQESISADTATAYLSATLEKIGLLSRLIQPRHAELAQLLAKQVNSRKLSETYRD